MEGKNCIVTGGNSGIGFETALALAKMGANLIIICRSEEKGATAAKMITAKSQNEHVEYVVADLSSQASIRSAAAFIRNKFSSIDVLINNAGAWFSKMVLTEDGVERQFAVNHVAYFLLTRELLPALKNSTDARIICVGSDSHFQGKMHFDDLNLTKKYHGLRAYAQSKLANALFVYELDRKLRELELSNITVNCVQPGLVKTDIGTKHTISLHDIAWRIRRMGGVSPAKGAETSIFLATSDSIQGESGKYWDKCSTKPSSKKSYIEEDAARLWDISLQLTGVEDYFESIREHQV